jgi:alpha-glucosidase
VNSADHPDVHDIIAEMRGVLESFADRVLIGEIYLPVERLVAYYGKDLTGAHLPFNFQLIHTAWNAHEIAKLVAEYERALPQGGWPNWVLGNHDQRRIATRVGNDQARVAAMLLLTLRGSPTMYYGDEIGLPQVPIPANRTQDPWEHNEPGLGVGRDPARTPMQWDASANAGFSSVEPWLPLATDYPTCNVASLRADGGSILCFYRYLIALRRRFSALSIGDYLPLATERDVLIYERRYGSERLIVALNLGHEEEASKLPEGIGEVEILLSTHLDRKENVSQLRLRPNEGVIGVVRPRA